MSRLSAILLVLAILFGGVIALELRPHTLDEDAMSAPTNRPSTAVPVRVPADRPREWLDTILARPLFAPDRRPAAAVAEGAAPSRLPRLTAILLDGPRHQVIFAGIDGGRPRVVAEGGELDGFRVRSIEAGQVTIEGPDGVHVVRPSFDPRPPAAASRPGVTAQPPNLSGLIGIPGLPVAR